MAGLDNFLHRSEPLQRKQRSFLKCLMHAAGGEFHGVPDGIQLRSAADEPLAAEVSKAVVRHRLNGFAAGVENLTLLDRVLVLQQKIGDGEVNDVAHAAKMIQRRAPLRQRPLRDEFVIRRHGVNLVDLLLSNDGRLCVLLFAVPFPRFLTLRHFRTPSE